MLQQFQLPPRPPFQKKVTARLLDEPSSKKPPGGNNKGHKKSFSQSSVLEEQPAWLDELLSDSDSTTQGAFHSRSSSDPMASVYDLGPEDIPCLDNDDRSLCEAFESACVFGPNSPRRRVNLDSMGKSVLDVLSQYESQIPSPFFVEGFRSRDFFVEGFRSRDSISFDPLQDRSRSKNKMIVEPKEGKRHPRQRSRVRKLQYIAELDKTVNDLQALLSKLQYEVSGLLQERITLSVENTKLKQQASKLQQQKLVLDSEYQTLRNEAERLKSGFARLTYQNKPLMHPKSWLNHVKPTDHNWEMLDWGKLNLG